MNKLASADALKAAALPSWVTPGWYPDPLGIGAARFWTGSQWSFDSRNQKPQPVPAEPTTDQIQANSVRVRDSVNPAGVVLACVGALAMAIAAFLPLDESGQFRGVQENALIHHGGWAFLALGAGIAVDAYRQYSTGRPKWTVVVLGVIALVVAILIGEDKGNRTLYGGLGDQVHEVVPLGLAVYVAAAGACAAILGGRIMRQSPSGETQVPAQTLKQCPDCAETIQAAAKVCKHCGMRFDDAPSPRS